MACSARSDLQEARCLGDHYGQLGRTDRWIPGGNPPPLGDFLTCIPIMSWKQALERMGSAVLNVLPVVSRANIRQILGIVVLDDILSVYGVGKPLVSSEGERLD